MDAGPDWSFLDNAREMGVDLANVDTVVLSHGHYDHAGGLLQFMEINDKAVIYAAKGYDLPHYTATGSYIGVEPALIDNPRIKVLSDDLVIDDEISILTFKGKSYLEPVNTCGMSEGEPCGIKKYKVVPESFGHEQYLVVTDCGKRAVFSGCSHKGIINITDWSKELKPDAIVGGFHLMGVPEEKFADLDRIADALLTYPVTYYTGHCTGQAQFDHMKEIMKDKLLYAAAGSSFEI